MLPAGDPRVVDRPVNGAEVSHSTVPVARVVTP